MKTQSLTKQEIEMMIEQKVLELLGDPDNGLQLKEEFKKKINKRLKNLSDTVSHSEIMKKYASS